MDATTKLNGEQNESTNTENDSENVDDRKNPEVATAIEPEQELNDTFKEREDVDVKPDHFYERLGDEIQQQAIFAQEEEENIRISPLKRKRKVLHDEAVSTTKVPKNNKNGKVENNQRRRTTSLRRRVLLLTTVKKLFSQNFFSQEQNAESKIVQDKILRIAEGDDKKTKDAESKIVQDEILRIAEGDDKKTNDDSSEGILAFLSLKVKGFDLSHESKNSQTKSQDVGGDKSRISDGADAETDANSSGDLIRSSPYIKSQSISTNRSKEVPTIGNQLPCFSQSTPTPITSHVSTKKFQQPQRVRSSEEVWDHFILYLEANKEFLDREFTDGTTGENRETSESADNSSKYPTKTERNSTNRNSGELATTIPEYVTTEIPNDLSSEISKTWHTQDAIKFIQAARWYVLGKMMECEKKLKTLKGKGQKESDMEKRIKYLTGVMDLQKNVHTYFNILYDQQYMLNRIKQKKNYSSYDDNCLGNPTSLVDLALFEISIRTFSSSFLYQYKSLYYEVPLENIYKRINIENYLLVYRKFKNEKVIQECDRKIIENIAVKQAVCFIVSLDDCRLKWKHVFPHFENNSLEECQKYINDLRIACNKNINCLKEIISSGSSVVFPVMNYLGESRIRTLKTDFFLDKKRPEVFNSHENAD